MKTRVLLTILFFVAVFDIKIEAMDNYILDSIYYLNGKTDVVNITKNTTSEIEFTYDGEIVVNVIPKSEISKVVYRSGRVDVINAVDKNVKEPQYAGNVCILTDDDELIPLEKQVMDNRVKQALLIDRQ